MTPTRDLASYVTGNRVEDIPADVIAEARRALLNFVGCALGGCREPAVDIVLRTIAPFSGPPAAAVLGRPERLDPLHASLANGVSSHVHDYDDTTPKNYNHPTSPCASALMAYASANRVSGRDFVHAFVLGFEAESRIANAVYPAHYDAGWHMTGTAGVFGAAVAVGKLLRLEAPQMVWAIGLAATQSAGLREMFGSMGKAFHPGRSAQNGYLAALLAAQGFTAGEHPLEGPRGFAAVTAGKYDLSKITDRLGVDFDLRENTYKPFACGIVNHPTIDACIQIHDEAHPPAEAIAEVRLRVAPLVLDLCNQQHITRGLQGKFSVYHGAAVGLVRGRAGLQEYTDEAVGDPAVRRVRERTTATGDPSIGEDQARVEVRLADGRRLERFVEASIGNVKRPMTNAQLEEKFRRQAARALPSEQVELLIERCWRVDALDDVGGAIVAASVPMSAGVQPLGG